MFDVRLRPLPAWPYPATRTRRSRWTFKATWPQTLTLLERELHHLGASNLLIAAGFADADLRLDGWPRAGARPLHPGVEVSFDTRQHGRLVYGTDACEDWQHNVRSIALGLEALRAVDRYGITRRGEQYAGWKALLGAVALGPAMGEEEARTLLRRMAELSGDDRQMYRWALKRVHPDNGGRREDFDSVQQAGRVLGVAS